MTSPNRPHPQWFAEAAAAACARLSARELEVLKLSCKGLTTRESAALLGISGYTVEKHKELIYRKLEVNTMVEAAVLAVKAGLA